MISLMNVVHLVQIGLAFLQTRLADVHEDHTNSGCSGQPTFSVETQFGVPALYMGCPICESVQCVLWFEYSNFCHIWAQYWKEFQPDTLVALFQGSIIHSTLWNFGTARAHEGWRSSLATVVRWPGFKGGLLNGGSDPFIHVHGCNEPGWHETKLGSSH